MLQYNSLRILCGEGGIRTPGTLRYAAFRVQCIQPDSATSPGDDSLEELRININVKGLPAMTYTN